MKYAALADRAVEAMQYDLLAFAALGETNRRFLPWSNAALRPAAIQVALNDISLNQHKTVLELGCGISTTYLAAFLARCGGQLITVDHDEPWLDLVAQWLAPAERAITTFVHAPLVKRTYAGEEVDWYDGDVLQRALGNQSADLVVIDGPPAYQKPHCLARGPAAEVIAPFLAPSATVILDDLNRSGERQIANDWSRRFSTEYTDLTVEAGIALWRVGRSHNISQ